MALSIQNLLGHLAAAQPTAAAPTPVAPAPVVPSGSLAGRVAAITQPLAQAITQSPITPIQQTQVPSTLFGKMVPTLRGRPGGIEAFPGPEGQIPYRVISLGGMTSPAILQNVQTGETFKMAVRSAAPSGMLSYGMGGPALPNTFKPGDVFFAPNSDEILRLGGLISRDDPTVRSGAYASLEGTQNLIREMTAMNLQLGNKARGSTDQIRKSAELLNLYGVNSLSEIKAIKAPDGSTMFYAPGKGFLPTKYGTSNRGEGGTTFTLGTDAAGNVVPNTSWYDTSTDLSPYIMAAAMAAAIAAPALLGAGTAAGAGAAGGAGAGLGTGLSAGAGGVTGLSAGAGALVPSSLAFAPAIAPAATIGGGALGSGLIAGAGALMPAFPSLAMTAPALGNAAQGLTAPPNALMPNLANAPTFPAAPTIGDGALGTGLIPGSGGVTGLVPSAAAIPGASIGSAIPNISPNILGDLSKVPTPTTDTFGGEGGGSSSNISDILSGVKSGASLASNLLGMAGGVAAAIPPTVPEPGIPGSQVAPTLPNQETPPSPDALTNIARGTVAAATRRRRGRSATILTDVGGQYEIF